MRYAIAVVDDAERDRESIRALARTWASSSGHGADVRGFPSAESFLFDGGAYDILLLDVEMEGVSGLDLARQLREAGNRAEIVFITSHFEFIAEGYEVDALHYLVKPVSPEKLSRVLDRAAERLAAEPPSVVVSCDGETVKLPESDILYVESFAHTVEIHTKNAVYPVRESITALGERLSADFYRAHRSYIVNLRAVERIGRTSVTLAGGAEVPLARGKYDSVNRAFIERN